MEVLLYILTEHTQKEAHRQLCLCVCGGGGLVRLGASYHACSHLTLAMNKTPCQKFNVSEKGNLDMVIYRYPLFNFLL